MSTIFWSGAALFVSVTLLLLLPPLLGRGRWAAVDRDRMNVGLYHDRLAELRREQETGEISAAQFEAAQEELQRDLLNTTGDPEQTPRAVKPRRWPAVVIAVLVPTAALGIYWKLGEPDLIGQRRAPTSESIAGDMDKMVEKLRQRLAQEPGDVDGWKLLGRSLYYLGRYPESAAATARAVELTAANPDPDLLAEYADTLALGNSGSFDGKPEQLLRQALALNPENPRALWLSGIHAYHQRNVRLALKHWRHLASVIPPDDELAGPLREAIQEAESVSGAKPQQ
jgi:cytochrome c-type biogenesis protein CcmH